MNIKSIDETKWMGGKWTIEERSFYLRDGVIPEMEVYVVQRGEDMRIDLVMQSIYEEETGGYMNCDIILYINNIDNPLNIREGMNIYYPPYSSLDSFRYYESPTNGRMTQTVKEQLSVPNKTTRKDDKRKKFIDSDYSLPPTVMKESRPSIVIEPGVIQIGGLK